MKAAMKALFYRSVWFRSAMVFAAIGYVMHFYCCPWEILALPGAVTSMCICVLEEMPRLARMEN